MKGNMDLGACTAWGRCFYSIRGGSGVYRDKQPSFQCPTGTAICGAAGGMSPHREGSRTSEGSEGSPPVSHKNLSVHIVRSFWSHLNFSLLHFVRKLVPHAIPWVTGRFLIISFCLLSAFPINLNSSFLLWIPIITFSWRSCFLRIVKPNESFSVSTWKTGFPLSWSPLKTLTTSVPVYILLKHSWSELETIF